MVIYRSESEDLMSITIKELPEVPETYFIDEAKSIPASHFGCVQSGIGYLGSNIRMQAGKGIMSGWALTVECPENNNMATFVALQYIRDMASQGRWIIVIAPPSDAEPNDAAMWTYLHSVMGWEVGCVGAVVAGYVRDMDEINEKLRGESSVFSFGGSPIPAKTNVDGRIGFPVKINGVTIYTGDLIVGDSDGVIVVPKDQVERVVMACREGIVKEVNLLQQVREGIGAIDVMGIRGELEGQVELAE
jgi:regulator of RNase E activity RraA